MCVRACFFSSFNECREIVICDYCFVFLTTFSCAVCDVRLIIIKRVGFFHRFGTRAAPSSRKPRNDIFSYYIKYISYTVYNISLITELAYIIYGVNVPTETLMKSKTHHTDILCIKLDCVYV